ncbi:hypothetical protein HK098_002968, partial [Nowakowskiella sp. JEL0407]
RDSAGFKTFIDDYLDISHHKVSDLLATREPVTNFTPLQVACEIGNLPMVKRVCGLGANVNVDIGLDLRNVSPYVTPAALACSHGHYDVLVYLLEVRKAIFEVRGVARCLDVSGEQHLGDDNEIEVRKDISQFDSNMDNHTFPDLLDASGVYSLLYPSVFYGYREIVIYLIQHGANVNLEDEFHRTPSSIAVIENQLEILEVLIKNNATFGVDEHGIPNRELMLAVSCGSADIVKYFLDHRIVNYRNVSPTKSKRINGSLEEIIMMSILEKKSKIFQYLLERFPVTAVQQKIITAAVIHDNSNILRLLISHERAVSLRETVLAEVFGSLPHTFRPDDKFVQNVETLLQFGANVNYRNDVVGPAALFASRISLPLFKMLEKYGADLTATFKDKTILHNAASAEIVEYCVTKAEVTSLINKKDDSGMTPLMSAVQRRKLDFVRLLIQSGAGLNETKDQTRTVIQLALSFAHSNSSILGELVRFGAVPTQYDIICALKLRNCEMLKMMLPPDRIISYPISFFDGLLHAACKDNPKVPRIRRESEPPLSNDSMKYLIENANINVNFQFTDGDTLSHYAIHNNNYEMLSYLISRGADLDICNKKGMNVMVLAVSREDLKCISILLDKNQNLANEMISERLPIELISGEALLFHKSTKDYDEVRRRANVEGFLKLANLTNDRRLVWINVNRLYSKLAHRQHLISMWNPGGLKPCQLAITSLDRLCRGMIYFKVTDIGDLGVIDRDSEWNKRTVRKYIGNLLMFVARNWRINGEALPAELYRSIWKYRDVKWKASANFIRRKVAHLNFAPQDI